MALSKLKNSLAVCVANHSVFVHQIAAHDVFSRLCKRSEEALARHKEHKRYVQHSDQQVSATQKISTECILR